MSGQAPKRCNPDRAARPRTLFDQKKPIRKLTGRAVQTRQTLPASRVVVTVQEDPESPGTTNVQIMSRVSRRSNPQSSSTPSMYERSLNQLSDLLSSFLSRQTPAQRLEQAREEQRKIQEVAKEEEEEEEENEIKY